MSSKSSAAGVKKPGLMMRLFSTERKSSLIAPQAADDATSPHETSTTQPPLTAADEKLRQRRQRLNRLHSMDAATVLHVDRSSTGHSVDGGIPGPQSPRSPPPASPRSTAAGRPRPHSAGKSRHGSSSSSSGSCKPVSPTEPPRVVAESPRTSAEPQRALVEPRTSVESRTFVEPRPAAEPRTPTSPAKSLPSTLPPLVAAKVPNHDRDSQPQPSHHHHHQHHGKKKHLTTSTSLPAEMLSTSPPVQSPIVHPAAVSATSPPLRPSRSVHKPAATPAAAGGGKKLRRKRAKKKHDSTATKLVCRL